MLKRVVTRRLPGFRFEAESPPLAEWLPRMDVACLVGFAASGPLHVPVVVESVAQFEAIFGTDLQLAWDARRGTIVNAHLAPAVRAFFGNGGRRCWIVRVARTRNFDQTARAGSSGATSRDGADGDALNFARSNFFPVPGMARAVVVDGAIKSLAPAFARARSEGSWSDALEVSAALLTRPAQVMSFSPDALKLRVAVNAPDSLATGDLLRLTFKNDLVLLLHAARVEAASAEDAFAALAHVPKRRNVIVEGAHPVWLQTTAPDSVKDKASVTLTVFTSERATSPPHLTEASNATRAFAAPYMATLRVPKKIDTQSDGDAQSGKDDGQTAGDDASSAGVDEQSTGNESLLVGEAAVEVALPLEDAPAPGSVVVVEHAGGQMLLTVESLGIMSQPEEAGDAHVRITGRAHWLLAHAPALPADELPAGERLTFDLRVRKAGESVLNASDLAFGREGARFWGKLPTDEQIYRQDETAPVNAPVEELWQPIGERRFPLAAASNDVASDETASDETTTGETASGGTATGERDAIYFPVAMSLLAEQSLGAVRLQGDALERDGLAEFSAALFLDPDLTDTTTNDLLSRADLIRYLGSAPRPLRGLHAALSIEEVTIIAAPDAAQRSWTASDDELPLRPAPSRPFPRPAWWHFLDCSEQRPIPLVRRPQLGHFLACSVGVVERPYLEATTRLSETGTYTVAWRPFLQHVTFRAGTNFILEESASRDFDGATTIYEGTATSYTLYGRASGDYFYRVRAEVETEADEQGETGASGRVETKASHHVETSDWSNGIVVRVQPLSRWHLKEEKDYDPSDLLAVQRALIRLSAARADVLAVLALPAHYREDKSLEHAATLRRTSAQGARATANVPALEDGETAALSYGALYHPWLTGRDPFDVEKFRTLPPDGAACGVLARRALTRGAWVAPANEPVSGVVALSPPVLRQRWLDLQLAQINLIRQEPRGFLAMNADTLSLDEDVREINVRRLLSLLRRLCLRHGATYVFEPNSPAFRRLVQRGFESVLDRLFARGAFAGATASSSYRVVTTEDLNTPQSVDEGRFIVELRVAPSQPLTFMTIRLVQTGDRGLVTEVR